MKVLILVMSIVFSEVCFSQVKNLQFSVIKVTTIGNEDLYYKSDLLIVKIPILNSFKEEIKIEILDSIPLLNNYSFIKRLTFPELEKRYKNTHIELSVKTPNKSYSIMIGLLDQLFQFADTINYVLDYNKLDFKEKELLEKRKLEEEQEYLSKKEELLSVVKTAAEESATYYKTQINGKSHNRIADYLYEEGFHRTFSTEGSVFTEIFTLDFILDLITKSYYTIVIKLWYSYGYGNLYYDVSYRCRVLDQHY